MMTDPIADMLTRLRNANIAQHERVDIPCSRLKVEIAKLLKREGFIVDYQVVREGPQGILRVEAWCLEGNKSRRGDRIPRTSSLHPSAP